jgi:hypothetical protein
MLIINTTFQVSKSCEEEWTKWVRAKYIPEVIASGLLTEPRFCRLIIENEPDSESFAVQFQVKDIDTLDFWFQKYGVKIQTDLKDLFQEKVLSFTTVMENIELE